MTNVVKVRCPFAHNNPLSIHPTTYENLTCGACGNLIRNDPGIVDGVLAPNEKERIARELFLERWYALDEATLKKLGWKVDMSLDGQYTADLFFGVTDGKKD